MLILFTVLALVLANLPWTASAYHHLLEARLRIGFDGFSLDERSRRGSTTADGRFFFYVGLEIKREVIAGRLSASDRPRFLWPLRWAVWSFPR